MKKISLVFMFLAFTFGLAACNKEVDFELDSPINVAITQGVVSWDVVEEADHYIVFVDTTEYEVQTTSFSLNHLNLAEGTYNISVVSVKDEKLSRPSTVLSFDVGVQNSSLAAPGSVVITDGILTWEQVTGATSYVVHVGEQTFVVSGLTLDLTTKSIPQGNYTVYVVATDGTEMSTNSATVTYNVYTSVQQTTIQLAVVMRVNDSYTLDLDEDDFLSTNEYNDYYDTLMMANAYASASMTLGMSEAEAIDFFDSAFDMVGNQTGEMTLDDMMTNLDIFSDYDMGANDLATMIYELSLAMMDSNMRNMQQHITRIQEDVIEFNGEIDLLLNDSELIELLADMKTYATVQQYEALEELFEGKDYDLVMGMEEIIDVLLYNQGQLNLEKYKDLGKIYIHVQTLMQVSYEIHDDPDGIAILQDLKFKLDDLYKLARYNEFVNASDDEIASAQSNIATEIELKQSFIENKNDVIESIAIVIDFGLTIKETVSQDMIDLLDNAMTGTELTRTEMFAIKDELVHVLQTALPEAADFETIYNTLFMIAGSVSDTDMTAFMQYSVMMGQAHFMSIDMVLALLGDIDEDLIDEAMLILDNAKDLEGHIDLDNNPEVAIDLAVFVMTYIDGFMEQEVLRVEAMKTLVSDEFLEDVYVMVLDLMIEQVEDDLAMDQLEKTLVLQFLNDMKLEFDTYKAVVDIFGDMTGDVLGYLVSSELSLIKALLDIDQNGQEMNTQYLMNLMSIFEEMHMIDVEIFDELTSVEIDAMFNAVRLPLKLIVEMNTMDGSFDFDDLYAEVSSDLQVVILNAISLQADFMIELDHLSLLTIILNPNILNQELATKVAVIIVVSETLTIENEALILETLDIIFDDILSNEDVLALTEMTLEAVVEMKTGLVTLISETMDEFQDLGTLDFDNLTQLEKDRISYFMDDLESGGMILPMEPGI